MTPSPSQPRSCGSSATLPRYAISGLSCRGLYHYLLPLMKTGSGLLVGILDPDRARIAHFNDHFGMDVPGFSPQDGIRAMIAATRPEVLLVTGPDHTHCEAILAGLEANLRVIAEKPVVINAEQMRRVMEAEKTSQGLLVVTHNLRYSHVSRAMKEVLLSGRIGRITSVEMVYNLDPRHGASYFCRWNRRREASGGLSVHKSVHHLDLVNWLLADEPVKVFAFGGRHFFGPDGAHRPPGDDLREQKRTCPYYAELQAHHGFRGEVGEVWDRLGFTYKEQYPNDRYLYDEEIDIEDTYSAVVAYRRGATLTYSCCFSAAWEGANLAFNGTLGRLEANWRSGPRRQNEPQDQLRILSLFGGGKPEVIRFDHGDEGHGGADPLIRRDLFGTPSAESLRLGLQANSRDGALAVLAGEAIWRSVETGQPVALPDHYGWLTLEAPASVDCPARSGTRSR